MKRIIPTDWVISSLLMLMMFFMMLSTAWSQTPISINGKLRVSGNKILNKNNQPVSFAGPSYFWSNTGWGADRFYNASVVNYFRSNWKSTIIRAAMGVEESGGYLGDPSNKARVKTVVDAAIANGMYVIIDWHTHKAEHYQQAAIDFFREMAQTYGAYDNVIYEIYNEPLNVNWSATIKPYANAVIGAIRAIDPDNLIIVGTPNWSQDVDVAANDPIAASNIAYTLHFYAASHKEHYRSKASTALSKGIALFVTEWGTCQDYGGGFVDVASTNDWMAFLKANNISHCNWSINDKNESASILNSGVNANGSWSDSDLTASGKLVKGIVSNWGGTPPACTTVNLPGIIQAESYCDMSGVQTENTTDSGGGQNVGWIDTGDWMAYSVSIPTAGSYKVSYRVASALNGGSIKLEKQGGSEVYGSITFTGSNGWQQWKTVTHTVQLPQGNINLAVAAATGGFNLNWIDIQQNGGPFSLTVQAENFGEMSGIQTETTSDAGGGLNVGWIDSNDWMKYKSISVPSSGTYLIEYRVASPNSNGVLSMDLNAGAVQLGTIGIPYTGGWQQWQTISRSISLQAGTYDFGIFAATGGWNLNWWRISSSSGARIAQSEVQLEEAEALLDVFPNPSKGAVTIRVSTPSTVRIFDATGKSHFEKHVMKDSNVYGLRPGIYVVRAASINRVKVQKLIITE